MRYPGPADDRAGDVFRPADRELGRAQVIRAGRYPVSRKRKMKCQLCERDEDQSYR
jgi:hypothetical protein